MLEIVEKYQENGDTFRRKLNARWQMALQTDESPTDQSYI